MFPREGSTLYYSLLWTPADARQRFLSRLALVDAIATTLDDVQDANVAEHKVHWWHEELERLHNGVPRHPQTSACRESLVGDEKAQAHLLEILSVAAPDRLEPASTDIEHGERLDRDHGARLALLAHALDPAGAARSTPLLDTPELARGLGLRNQLARLPVLLHRGHPVFSNERYARHGTDPSALARHVRIAPSQDNTSGEAARSTPVIGNIPIVTKVGDRHALVAEAVDEAHRALTDGMADRRFRDNFGGQTLAPVARLIALRHRELALWQKHRPDLLRERTTLTPFRRFLVAQRFRRGAR